METGLEVIQKTLRRTMKERDAALARSTTLRAELRAATGVNQSASGRGEDLQNALGFISEALAETADNRDRIQQTDAELSARIDMLRHQARLTEERNNRIFSRLETAVNVSMDPLDKMFKRAGIPTDKILADVRRGYSGQGSPLTPITFSTKGTAPAPAPETRRFNTLIGELDRINIYRIAAERLPFSFPLRNAYRLTSPFGPRHGRMHEGDDLAAPLGTPIYATADGVVTKAGWSSCYGRLIKIRHTMGYETRYGHLSRIRVKEGQRVSRGDRIGDIGSSGHSTGPHLHYEIRIGGRAINPMIYIKAGRDVF